MRNIYNLLIFILGVVIIFVFQKQNNIYNLLFMFLGLALILYVIWKYNENNK